MELLNQLSLLASEASESAHTPENPAYDYVDNSREDEEQDDGDDEEDEEDDEEEDDLSDLPAVSRGVSQSQPSKQTLSSAQTTSSSSTTSSFQYTSNDLKEVLSVLHRYGRLFYTIFGSSFINPLVLEQSRKRASFISSHLRKCFTRISVRRFNPTDEPRTSPLCCKRSRIFKLRTSPSRLTMIKTYPNRHCTLTGCVS